MTTSKKKDYRTYDDVLGGSSADKCERGKSSREEHSGWEAGEWA